MDVEYLENIKYYKNYNKQYNIKEIKEILIKNNLLDKLYQEANDIKEDYLYKSDMHGLKHNQKVVFFAYILCYFYKINKEDYRIIMDACKYHDIGRKNDEDDAKHGIRSSKMLVKILKDDTFYQGENMSYLRAIVELHSNSDKNNMKYYKKYKLSNYDRFSFLYKILKDADGLDRVRLYKDFPDVKWLNPDMLRLDKSKQLIKVAHEVNYLTRTN